MNYFFFIRWLGSEKDFNLDCKTHSFTTLSLHIEKLCLPNECSARGFFTSTHVWKEWIESPHIAINPVVTKQQHLTPWEWGCSTACPWQNCTHCRADSSLAHLEPKMCWDKLVQRGPGLLPLTMGGQRGLCQNKHPNCPVVHKFTSGENLFGHFQEGNY